MNSKIYSLNILFFFIFLTEFFSYICPNKIVIPFKTKSFPFDPNNEFKYIFKNEIFTTLEIGTPPQKVELFLEMRTPYFIIKNNDSFSEYYKNTSSSTYEYFDNKSTYYFNDDILKRGIHSGEKIILQNSFNNNDKFEINHFDFVFCTEYEEDSKDHMGVLGIQFFSTNNAYIKEVNFINTLKRNKIITNYIFYFNYTSDNSGYLVIGDFPHTFNNKYDKGNLNQKNLYQEGNQKFIWNLYCDNIKYGDINLNEHKTVKFSAEYGVIFAPHIFEQTIIKEFFEEYLNQSKCERKTYNEKHDYFVCDEFIKISNFKNIEFTIKELSEKNFVLTYKDVFLKKNGKLYFLIIFGKNWKWQYSWTFGKPFIKKYKFLYDQDGKQILYYSQDNNDKNNKNSKNVIGNKTFVYFIWGGIFVLLIIIGFLSYYIMKLIKERKKRLYELEDDYDYKSEENNKDENNINSQPINEEENKFGIN